MIKYPRTPHLPWSQGATVDDLRVTSADQFTDKQVVVTEKMDGENTSLYRDGLHARSLTWVQHESRAYVTSLHARVAPMIPVGWRICGENLYAVHRVKYTSLPDYFLVFSIWDEQNFCLPWGDTVACAGLMGLYTVPVIWIRLWDEGLAKQTARGINASKSEGYVVRTVEGFKYEDYAAHVAKFVVPNHVPEGTEHWLGRTIEKNTRSKRGRSDNVF